VWTRNSCPQLLMHFRVCLSPRCQSLVPFWLYPLACIRCALKVRLELRVGRDGMGCPRLLVAVTSFDVLHLGACALVVSPLCALRVPL
jgi:hypothetical protein